tara:strand:- start:562 stop:912 length:351 start_codon:yes stop_codon:yes gene_type:complete
VAKVKLTPKSTIGLLNITPDLEITREKEAEVSVTFAINRMGDPNLLFSFSEEDRLGLESASEQLLASAMTGLRVTNLTAKMLVDTLLPPIKSPKRRSITKPAKKETVKDSSESALL